MNDGNLAALPVDALAEALVEEFASLRKATPHEYYSEAHRVLARIIEARDAAAGAQLALLEVAEAAARAATRLQWGRSELALRAFAQAVPARASDLLSRLLTGPVHPAELEVAQREAANEVEVLFRTGALLRDTDDTVRLAARLRPAVKDLLRPPILRMWAAVDAARAEALACTKPTELLASRLAVDQGQAAQFLSDYPLDESAAFSAKHPDEEVLGRSVTPWRIVYQRPRRSSAEAEARAAIIDIFDYFKEREDKVRVLADDADDLQGPLSPRARIGVR